MKFLIVGLGSMGKRRARNLLALKYKEIIGYDTNSKRRLEFQKKYKLKTLDKFADVKNSKYDALIISTDPKYHFKYIKFAIKHKMNCFIEASIVNELAIRNEIKKIKDKSLVYAPSCCMRYYQLPINIKNLIKSKIIGKILYLNYHTGQYLPDWHPWENIKRFYVSNRATGGCREIVPFELNWINDIFGYPKKILSSYKNKISQIKANIDDIYNFSLLYSRNLVAQITIEILSRPKASRNITIVGDKGKIIYTSDTDKIKIFSLNKYREIKLKKQSKFKNYINPEIPYVNEMKDFISSIKSKNKKPFPSNFKSDLKLLDLLKKIELKSVGQ